MSFYPVFALSHVAYEQVKGLWVLLFFLLPDEHCDAKFTAEQEMLASLGLHPHGISLGDGKLTRPSQCLKPLFPGPSL